MVMSEENLSGADNGPVYINLEEGLKRVMNNAKLYIKLLNKFKAETGLDELAAAVEAEEYEKAQIKVHTMKGIAANLSLTELFKQSQELEAQIKNKAVKAETLETVKVCCRETIVNIDQVIKQYG
jgi:HPt (histidine-containing phosphotransfer) domain-containing protein